MFKWELLSSNTLPNFNASILFSVLTKLSILIDSPNFNICCNRVRSYFWHRDRWNAKIDMNLIEIPGASYCAGWYGVLKRVCSFTSCSFCVIYTLHDLSTQTWISAWELIHHMNPSEIVWDVSSMCTCSLPQSTALPKPRQASDQGCLKYLERAIR